MADDWRLIFVQTLPCGAGLQAPGGRGPATLGADGGGLPSVGREAPVDEAWWRAFDGPELSSLVDRAVHLFDWVSRMFMTGPSVTLPIFEGGELRGRLEMRRAEQREAAIAYRKAVLQAWHDVDNALTTYGEAQHRRRDAQNAARDGAVALRVAEQRYAEGVANFIDVTVAQADLLRAQDAAAQAQTDVLVDLVALYRALGGGWRAAEGRGMTVRSGAD